MKDKDIKQHPGGDTDELGAKPRHGGNRQAIQADFYAAEEAGVRAERDIRSVGKGPPADLEETEPDRGKEFSGPGRRRDPDDAG